MINISLSNRTTLPLTLGPAAHGGTDPHWGTEAPQTLAAGALALVSDNSAGDDTIDLEYRDSTGATYTFHAGAPIVEDNWVSHTTTSTSCDIYSQNGSGRTDNVAFMAYPGHEFDTSGAAQTYVVPPGVTQLTVDMVGGSTISESRAPPAVLKSRAY